MSLRLPTLGLAALCACTAQYDPCFTPPSEIGSLQVLAIRADPPDVRLNPDGSAPPVQVTALVVDPEARSTVTLSLGSAACEPTGTRRCAEAPAPAPAGALGVHTFTVQPTPELLQRALAADPLQGYGGLRVQLQLDALESTGVRASGEKLLLFAQPGDPRAINHGIELAGVRVRRFSHLYHEDTAIPLAPEDEILPPGKTLMVDVGDPIWLTPVLAPGAGATEALETYQVADLSGRTVSLQETVTYSFYDAAHGVLSDATGTEPVSAPPQGLTSYRYLKYGGGDSLIWIVARDSRGAQAWMEVPVRANDLRTCWELHSACPRLEFGCL